MRIDGYALDSDKHHALTGLTGVVDDISNLFIGVAHHLQWLDGGE